MDVGQCRTALHEQFDRAGEREANGALLAIPFDDTGSAGDARTGVIEAVLNVVRGRPGIPRGDRCVYG
jgi:hypothetical protein